ncbi:MarR family winged helix-turn-helix transcriptional regulator [Terrabacter terrigena]|uniref:MarR family winged helix-turn-helix transcriptional regulator n=1 Tax=Terrabacter terrigena TaxID=574718 RepID=A0ABW3MZQ7_9MICO
MSQPHRSESPSNLLADDLYDVLGLVRRRSRRLVGAPLPELDLSGAQLELVRAIRRNPGLAVADAAAALGLAPNTISTLVGQLVSLDVVVRERDPHDRRVARLHLTAHARAAVEQWRDQRAQAMTAVLDSLDASTRARIAQAIPLIAEVAARLPDAPKAPAAPDLHTTGGAAAGTSA